jgi:hypothetical protein
VLGGAPDIGLTWGAILEMFLILFNVASAVAIYPVLKRRFPVLSLAFVGARLPKACSSAWALSRSSPWALCGRRLGTPIRRR